MTVVLLKMRQGIAHSILCFFVGILGGGILLLDVSLKWEIAFLGALGTSVLMMIVGSPKRILLFGLAFTVPIYFSKAFLISQNHGSVANGADINLADVLSLALLLLLLAKSAIRQVEIRFFPLITIPALAWLILSSVSLLAARDSELAIIQLINMGKLLLLYWVVANSVGNKVDVIWVIGGLILGMLFQALVGVYQGVTGNPLGLDFLTETAIVHQQRLSVGLANRVQGTIGHPNSYAMYVTTVIPFTLALLYSKTRTLFKVLAGITLCLGCIALVYSLSRTAWVNFLVVFSIILALAVRRKRISSQIAVLITGTTFLVLLVITFFGTDIILSRLTSDDQGAAYSRVTQAQTALTIIKDHPLMGAGLNNYALIIPQYDTRSFVHDKLRIVHNVFLLIAAETGLLGLTAFLVFLAVLLVQAWRIINRASDDIVWVAGVGVFSAFVVLAISGMVDYSLLGASQPATQFRLLAGLCAALIQRIDYEEHDPRRVTFGSNTMVRKLHSY